MAIAWPAFLQGYLNQDSFSYQIGETRIMSESDIGPAKSRRRFTKSVDTIQCTIDIKKSDWTNFYDFWDVTLNGGIEYFTFDHPFTSVSTEFRMPQPPRVDPIGGEWLKVTMSWEKRP